MPKGNRKKKMNGPTVKIVSTILEQDKVELVLKLKYAGVTQTDFLRAVVTSLTNEDARFMPWFNEWAKNNSKYKGKKHHKKMQKLREEGEHLASQFGINDGDIENIYDGGEGSSDGDMDTGDTINLPPFSTISLIVFDKLFTSKHM